MNLQEVVLMQLRDMILRGGGQLAPARRLAKDHEWMIDFHRQHYMLFVERSCGWLLRCQARQSVAQAIRWAASTAL